MNTTAKSLSESQMYHIPFFANDTSNKWEEEHHGHFDVIWIKKEKSIRNYFDKKKQPNAVAL